MKIKTPLYVLGPDDQIAIRALEAEEINEKPVRIDGDGYINLPLIGRVRAGGLTVQQLEAELVTRLKAYIQDPQVAVSVSEFRSQPVSVIGSVNAPGVVQLQGRKTLFEVLSMAGGLRADAGYSVRITRRREYGPVPLPGAADDPTGQYSTGHVSLKALMEARNPGENIVILPHDVISVPRGELVYVIGEVKTSGGFVLNHQETISVLQALSLAGGLLRTASTSNAMILRTAPDAPKRTEIPVDLAKILSGKAADVGMEPNDILFVPNSPAKHAVIRTLESALSAVTGIAIYRRY